MKKVFFLAVVLFNLSFSTVESHFTYKPPGTAAGIYLFIPTITTAAGVAANGHADEVLVNAFSEGIANPFTGGGGGGGTGVPVVSDFVFSKSFDRSSLRMKIKILNGSFFQTAELRYYDGVSSSPVYKIAFTNVRLTSISGAGSPCVSGNCPLAEESFSLIPVTVSWINYVGNPATPQILTYNLSTRAVTSSNL